MLGGELAELAPDTIAELDKVLPPHWSHDNPVDIIGDAGPERFEKAVEIVAKDPERRWPAGHHDAAGHDQSRC